MPLRDSRASKPSLFTKSRRTGSCRSLRQSSLIAVRMWFLSYALVSSSTSTRTTFGSSRCASTQSASTSAFSRLMAVLLRGVVLRRDALSGDAGEAPGLDVVDEPEDGLAAGEEGAV